MAETDGELVRRARQGDHAAFAALVDRYRDMVYGLAYHRSGDFEAARDLAQEAFVQAYVSLSRLREPDRFGAWLRAITENVHRTRCRRKEVATVALEDSAQVPGQGHSPSAIELTVREALSKLREPERLALTLHYINGYSHAEIGAFLGVRAETVKTRLARARQSLREGLLQMAEDLFREHALPPEFRQDVIGGVNRLVANLRAALPDNLQEVRDGLRRQWGQAWRRIVAALPPPWSPPLKEQGQPPRIPVADLPEGLRVELRDSLYHYWLYALLGYLESQVSWVSDPDAVSVRFCGEGGEPHMHLQRRQGSVSETYGTSLRKERNARDRRESVEEADEGLAEYRARADQALPPDVAAELAKLRAGFPKVTGWLGRATWGEMHRLLREAGDQVRGSRRGEMEAGKAIAARHLPARSRDALMRAEALHWAVLAVGCVTYVPMWLTDFEKNSVEFGVLPADSADTGSSLLLFHLPELALGWGFYDPAVGGGKPYVGAHDQAGHQLLKAGIPEAL